MKKEEKKEHIINLTKKINKKENFDLGGLLPQIFTLFGKELKTKLIACFESLDDFLFDLADKAESNQKQNLYFESMRYIRKSRELIFKEFFQSIKITFKKFKNNDYEYFVAGAEKKHEKQSLPLSMSLVDEKELDETLAKTNLIKKSEMAYHQHLFAIEKRFSVLASGTNLNLNQIPIAPHVMVNAFSQGINKIDTEVEIKLIVYKMFERNVMGQMNNIYNKINNLLAKSGIIPEINYNIGNTNTNAGNPDVNYLLNQTNYQNNAPQQNLNQNNANNLAPQADNNYEMINQLFKHNHDSGTPNTGNNVGGMNANAPNIDMGLMINALSLLQGDLFKNIKLDEQADKTPTEIKDELIKQLHALDSETVDQKVKQQDEDTIDLVGMLFQFIVDDRNLPDTIQVILAKLQIPYLKIALQDRNLFADKNNPARMLLDKMSLATVGWSEESDNRLQMLHKIEEITKKVLEIDEYNKDFFNALLQDFNKFTHRQKKKADVMQKRTAEKSLGQDKIHQAKQITAQLLVEKMTNKQMPILIRDILLGEWSNVLVLMHLRHPENSPEYLEKIEFVDKLIDYTQVHSEAKVDKNDIIELSNIYEKGLKLVAFNAKELIDKQDSLISCLSKLHKLDSASNTAIIDVIPPEEILELSEMRKQKHEIVDYIEEIIEPEEIDESAIDDVGSKYLDIVANLKTGTWFEFDRDDKKPIRAKLSWVSPITGKFLFVNSRGLKITDKTTLELSLGLKNNTIRVLEQVPIFDRALSAIASKLRKEEPKKSDS